MSKNELIKWGFDDEKATEAGLLAALLKTTMEDGKMNSATLTFNKAASKAMKLVVEEIDGERVLPSVTPISTDQGVAFFNSTSGFFGEEKEDEASRIIVSENNSISLATEDAKKLLNDNSADFGREILFYIYPEVMVKKGLRLLKRKKIEVFLFSRHGEWFKDKEGENNIEFFRDFATDGFSRFNDYLRENNIVITRENMYSEFKKWNKTYIKEIKED